MIRRRQPKLLDVAAEMAKVHEIQVPQLQGAIKRKVVDTKKQDSTKQSMWMETKPSRTE